MSKNNEWGFKGLENKGYKYEDEYDREHAGIIRKLNEYEKLVRIQLSEQVTVFSAKKYSQSFLRQLIPGSVRNDVPCTECGETNLVLHLDGKCDTCYRK